MQLLYVTCKNSESQLDDIFLITFNLHCCRSQKIQDIIVMQHSKILCSWQWRVTQFWQQN